MNTNEILDQTASSTLVALEQQIHSIIDRYQVNLNFEDIFGICKLNAEIEKTLSPYAIHNNHFCNYIKRDKTCFWKCVINKSKVIEKCKKLRTPFFGTCYMGISEFVFPVICKNKLVAVLFIGQFYADNEAKNQIRLQKGIRKYRLPEKTTTEYFEKIIHKNVDIEQLIYDVNILCKLILLLLYEYGFETKSSQKLETYYNNHIIQNVIALIHDNYNKELSLALLSAQCYCNPSYLSRLVKKKTGMTVTDYISMVRVNEAKSLIDLTNLSITDIGYRVGFNDVAYFSRVFKKHTGMTPKEYRMTN